MIDYIMENYWLLWTIIGLVCLTLEMTSGDFFLTCFAVGAFGSAIATAFGMPFYGQVLTFALVSVLSIFLYVSCVHVSPPCSTAMVRNA